MARLTITSGPNAGLSFEMAPSGTTIGREYTQDIVLADAKVSRQHALVLERDGVCFLKDLGSSNGSYLNDGRVEEAPLADGDIVRIGATEMRYSRAAAPDTQARMTEELKPQKTVELSVSEVDALDRLAGGGGAGGAEMAGPTAALLALGKIARDLAAADTLDELYADLTRHLARALESDRVYVLEPAGDGAWRIASSPESRLDRKLAETPVSRTIVSHVADARVGALVSAPEEDERFRNAASIVTGEIVTAAAAPVTAGERLAGVLYADRLGRGESFGEEALELLVVAAGQASLHVERLELLERARRGKHRLEKEIRRQYSMAGESPEMEQVFEFIERAAPSGSVVLVLGESGTGKELVARAIHFGSPRSDGPFEVVNCAALAESLAESELFGHAKGAFTGASSERPGRFELADGGTIFLDEVGELSAACQSKLLRVLENGESVRVGEARVRKVDVRVVAATNRDLDARVKAGEFRKDLFYRLNVLRVEAPPLRRREGDVELLTGHFLRQFAELCGRSAPELSGGAKALFGEYGWPGNVRELKNICERLVVMCPSDEIAPGDLPPEMRGAAGGGVGGEGSAGGWDLEELERAHILRAIEAAGGNKSRAAEMLGIDRSTLYARLKKYGEDEGD